ncbi:TKL/LISK protein kinase [Saprolegnia parasitica CBS 223.65]|uniref:TKL/LISK protein kinase n=1 Tax=Saprolegnia parasitica (strain CBS 223.65) TaxID=695850 RepID=A0A067BWW6_SAPPC|nr:TKL/LISK protein kinase [Saprolegnia parasitica CBS 223.65]KDO18786.1 TKL/LISK protein kinase [Saprolegnia parasitica CBS 223.65]|eukprot:XP_012210508.1 TKL/LISK protein kinase [Saprolegnia parasitica CBS 223.65]
MQRTTAPAPTTPDNSIAVGWASWARSTSTEVVAFKTLCAGVPISQASDAMRACCGTGNATSCAWFAQAPGLDAWGVYNATASAAATPMANTTLYNVSVWTSCAQIATLQLTKLHIDFDAAAPLDHMPDSLTFRSNLMATFPISLFRNSISSTSPVTYMFENNRFEAPIPSLTPSVCLNLNAAIQNNQVVGTQGAAIVCNCSTPTPTCSIPEPTPKPTSAPTLPPTTTTPAPTPAPTSDSNSRSHTGLVIGVVLGAAVLIALCVFAVRRLQRARKTRNDHTIPLASDEHLSPASASGSHFGLTDYKPQISPGIRLSRVEERRPLSHPSLGPDELPNVAVECIAPLPSRRRIWSGTLDGLPVVVQRLGSPSDDKRTRYISSVKELAGWRHPHVQRVLSIVANTTENGEVSTVVEAMPGGTLANVLVSQPLLWPEKLRLCYQIAAGLQFAHAHAVWPRAVCLTSSRVLLDADRKCKLNILDYVDMGVDESDDDDDGFAWRGMPWEAPEVLSEQSHRTDAADMYAFGVICCEIAMGSRPTKTWLHARAYEEDPTLAACPSFFQSVVFACLDVNPAKRPPASAVAGEFSGMKE